MVGFLSCYDQGGNMILTSTQEYLQHRRENKLTRAQMSALLL